MIRPLDIAYWGRRLLLRLLRWPTRGVAVMAFDGRGDLLLVRLGYGRRDIWQLPGGGIGRRETPARAAARELREETGCVARDLTEIGTYVSHAQGRRDTITLFRACVTGPARADGREVEEVRFVSPDALPEPVSDSTRRRLAELNGLGAADGRW